MVEWKGKKKMKIMKEIKKKNNEQNKSYWNWRKNNNKNEIYWSKVLNEKRKKYIYKVTNMEGKRKNVFGKEKYSKVTNVFALLKNKRHSEKAQVPSWKHK